MMSLSFVLPIFLCIAIVAGNLQQCLSNFNVYPTGVDDNYNLLSRQGTHYDTHWSICDSSNLPAFNTCFGAGSSPNPCCPTKITNWAPNSWEDPVDNAGITSGFWIEASSTDIETSMLLFAHTFNVPANCATATLKGRCWADNMVNWGGLNGVIQPLPCSPYDASSDYTNSPSFELNASTGLVAGDNTLTFFVRNYQDKEGLLVIWDECNCEITPTVAPTPEPVCVPHLTGTSTVKSCNETYAVETATLEARDDCEAQCFAQGKHLKSIGGCGVEDKQLGLDCCDDGLLDIVSVECACCCDCNPTPAPAYATRPPASHE